MQLATQGYRIEVAAQDCRPVLRLMREGFTLREVAHLLFVRWRMEREREAKKGEVT